MKEVQRDKGREGHNDEKKERNKKKQREQKSQGWVNKEIYCGPRKDKDQKFQKAGTHTHTHKVPQPCFDSEALTKDVQCPNSHRHIKRWGIDYSGSLKQPECVIISI